MARILFLLSLAALVFACFACTGDDDDDNDDDDDDDDDDDNDDDDDDEENQLVVDYQLVYLDGGGVRSDQYSFAASAAGAPFVAAVHGSALVFSSHATNETLWRHTTFPQRAQSPALAVDRAGGLHFAYLNESGTSLLVGGGQEGAWTTTPVANSSRFTPPLLIGVDDAGTVQVAFIDQGDQDHPVLRHATIDGGSVALETVTECFAYEDHPSMVVTPDGAAHLSFRDADKNLVYATDAGGDWSVEIVQEAGGLGQSSLAVDEDDVVHVVYEYAGDLTWASRAGLAWEKRNLELNGAYYQACQPRLGAGPDGRFALLYKEYWQDERGAKEQCYFMMYHNLDGAWEAEKKGTSYFELNFVRPVFDDEGYLHYAQPTGLAIDYCTNRDDNWMRQTAVRSSKVTGAAMQPHADGSPAIVYTKDKTLWLAEQDDAAWTFAEILDEAVDTPSLAVDADDFLHLAFHHQSREALHYATDRTGEWVRETVVEPRFPHAQDNPSLALDAQGDPHIVMDRSGSLINDGFFYHHRENNEWLTEKIFSGSGFGNDNLLLDDADNLYISFISSQDDRVALADNRSGDWLYTPLDTAYNTKRALRMLWNDEELCLAFQTYVGKFTVQLKLIRYQNDEWEVQTLATGVPPNYGLAFTRDSQGHLYLLFIGGPDNNLRLMTDRDGAWSTHRFDLPLEVFIYHAAYLDEATDTLRLALLGDEALWCLTIPLGE